MTDQLLADRYRLETVLGRGGMAEVHGAYDTLLERDVAVKILLPHYRDDQQFIERFRREAQNAASLNHPNIIAVYDTGQHEDLPFIVMELVRGRSLEQAIADEGLTEDRALEICADVCAGLSYAHERGLVHRDVKPGNILLADDGTVKVADLGIARAVAAENVTETAAVLGTAAYLSPEQAQGRSVDARSDIYSLGVVLYEALTGTKPFEGDSAVTVAYQHVQQNAVHPRDLNGDITAAAEAICVRAMAKDPADRYASAAEMRQDLLSARVGDQVTAPAVRRGEHTALLDPAAGADTAVPTERGRRRRRRIGYGVLGALTVAATLLAVVFLGSLLDGGTETVTVPDVTGQSVSDAQRTLEGQGLSGQVAREVFSSEVPVNRVVRQQPSAGASVEVDSTVDLFISRGPEQVDIPNVVGRPESEATSTLREAGLAPVLAGTEPSDEYDEGQVIRTDPESGTTVDVDSEVRYTVSTGEEQVRVPPVDNQTESQARFDLERLGFEVLVVREFSPTVPEGTVIRQDPDAGTELDEGSEVTIVVSRGAAASPEPEPTTPPPSPTETPDLDFGDG